MKTLYLIGGPMGVGKTTVGRELKLLLPRSVFLDGDWCWDMHPFQVTAETKTMVLANIQSLLRNFLACSALENIVFCWVMDEMATQQAVLSGLELEGVRVIALSLVCTPEELQTRLEKDIRAGLRERDILARSLSRLRKYNDLDTVRIDTTGIAPDRLAERIAALGENLDVPGD